jgi:hypothetical protein
VKFNIKNKGFFILVVAGISMQQCRVAREIQMVIEPEPEGLAGLEKACIREDTLNSLMIHEAEARIIYEGDQYEVNTTVYVEKDSIIYISAVRGGFEILRASVEPDSIKVIDRMNRVVYRTAMHRKFGYQHPFTYRDLQCLISRYFFCREIGHAQDDFEGSIMFDLDQDYQKKRIIVDREDIILKTFEFYHSRTDEYLMGERTDEGMKIYSNFMIGEIEVTASGGNTIYNHHVDVRMEVNPRRYSFIDLQ